MRSSLLYKLLGAFLLVVLVGAAVMALLTTQATKNAFDLYTTRSGQAWAQRLAPVLAEYYRNHPEWQEVEAYLLSGVFSAEMTGLPGKGMGRMMGQGQGYMAGMMDQRFILVNPAGVVIADTGQELTGQTLSAEKLANGAAILLEDNRPVGTLLVTSASLSGSNSPAGQFLTTVDQTIILSVAAAGLIALLLGAGLFYQITAPLRHLDRAARAIAAGDLSQRVAIQSHDELGKLSQAFNQMSENLERAAQQRQHMVADIAHELRTPITIIQANLEGILDGVVPLDTEQIAGLHDETRLLNRLVDDLRLLSQAEAGELRLERQATELAELIRQVVDRSQFQAQQHQINLKMEVEEPLPGVWVDQDRISQVLNNLIGNAFRYTPERGEITIRANQTSRLGRMIEVSVTDNGPGIDNDDLPFIFDRFYRADQSRARTSGGSGLGLAIVKQLVEAHGGRVVAISPVFPDDPNGYYGTRFTFTLPVYPSMG